VGTAPRQGLRRPSRSVGAQRREQAGGQRGAAAQGVAAVHCFGVAANPVDALHRRLHGRVEHVWIIGSRSIRFN
jgi:hypothetical protein